MEKIQFKVKTSRKNLSSISFQASWFLLFFLFFFLLLHANKTKQSTSDKRGGLSRRRRGKKKICEVRIEVCGSENGRVPSPEILVRKLKETAAWKKKP